MLDQGLKITDGNRSFRHCVQDCACDSRMVAAYNQLYCAQLQAPILALLTHEQGEPGPSANTQEGAELARFILFCYDTVWRHVRRAQQRTTWWPVKVTGRQPTHTDSRPNTEPTFGGASAASVRRAPSCPTR